MDALYFRVSSDRQTTENQFEDVLQEAARNPMAYLGEIRRRLAEAILEDPEHPGVFRVHALTAACLADASFVYIEHASGKPGSIRPMFQKMIRDAQAKRFDRLLVWKVSRLGRDMREVISTVYELADLGITVVPVKSQTGPITSSMGKLLWAIQAWYAEIENTERIDAIRAGQLRARKAGTHLGRPRRVFDREQIAQLRARGQSWSQIVKETGIPMSTAQAAFYGLARPTASPETA